MVRPFRLVRYNAVLGSALSNWGKSDSREIDMRGCTAAAVLAAVLVAGSAAAAYAQLAVSANDAKVKLVNGKTEV